MREFSYQSGKNNGVIGKRYMVFLIILYTVLIYLLFTSDFFLGIVLILSPIIIYSIVMNKLFDYVYDNYTKYKSIYD